MAFFIKKKWDALCNGFSSRIPITFGNYACYRMAKLHIRIFMKNIESFEAGSLKVSDRALISPRF